MIQYIASDVDGTLLHGHATELNPELFDIIRQLKEHGIHFIAASGRQYKNLRRLFAPVKDDISYVAENGSMCVHDGKIVSLGHCLFITFGRYNFNLNNPCFFCVSEQSRNIRP